MARYSSDSDDDRRSREKRSKSSRKRDRRSRSRSRDRRRRSRSRSRSSRSHRRRSRSRSLDRRSSDDNHHRSRRSRSDRDRRSRSPSEERQREKRDKDAAVEKTKQRLKEALNQAETNDDDLIRAKEKKKLGKEVIPNSELIAEIESHEFVQQSFSSSAKDKQATSNKTQPEVLVSSTKASPVVFGNLLTDSSNGKGLFAARVLEDESTKMERWIKKLSATRNKMLATGSIKH